MITKKYRLTEKEVKKVLQRWKPFFSHNMVSNKLKNDYTYNRFAIVISGKSVKNSVERNFFRRRFYDYVKTIVDDGFDIVFVVKSKVKLDKKDENSLRNFYKDLDFLIKNIWKNF